MFSDFRGYTAGCLLLLKNGFWAPEQKSKSRGPVVAVRIFDRAARGPPLEIPLAELKATF